MQGLHCHWHTRKPQEALGIPTQWRSDMSKAMKAKGSAPRNVSRYRDILDTGDVDLGAEDGRRGSDPNGGSHSQAKGSDPETSVGIGACSILERWIWGLKMV